MGIPMVAAGGSEAAAVVAVKKLVESVAVDIYEFCKRELKKNLRQITHRKTIDEIVRHVKGLNAVRTILLPDIDTSLIDVYYPSRLELSHRPKSNDSVGVQVGSLRELPPGRNYIFRGTVGQGKTFFLKYLAFREVSNGDAKSASAAIS